MSLYDILNIPQTSTKRDIKKAFHKLVLQYHPDKSDNIGTTQKFREIKAAYEILYDDEKRKEYDSITSVQKGQLYDLLKQHQNL